MSSDGVRLTPTSYAVLGLIEVFGPSSPYDLKRRIEQTIANFWPVPHTTFYVEPARLAEAGLLGEHQESGGRRRKRYELTDAGREALRRWVDEPAAAPPQLRDELELKVFLGADPAPLARERVRWHEDKLAELEGYLAAVGAVEGFEAVARALEAGIAYHRALAALQREWAAS